MTNRINKRIFISRHKKEWKIIFKKINELGYSKQKLSNKEAMQIFHNYVNKKMHSLAEDYNECPDCVMNCLGKKVKVPHYVNHELYRTFEDMAEKSELPIATIVDRLIINPLIIELMV